MLQLPRIHLIGASKQSTALLLVTLTGLVAAVAVPESSQGIAKPTSEQAAFFETRIRPVLASNCYPCHGGAAHSSGLRLDTLTGIQRGGDSGPAIVAGEPEKSTLILAIRQTGKLKMPPTGKKLSVSEVADLEAWVKMGVPWPDSASKQDSAQKPWWSLVPVRKPVIPNVKNRTWIRNPIDAFVLSKLEAKQLVPAPGADRRTLIRRVSYDLTGLAPTPDEVTQFLGDKSPSAYLKVVDRLLSSKQYGERWARHWMDVARYADTKGYVFQEDRNYPNAYTYRDWLISAFNRDLPFDQFVTQQLAADKLLEGQPEADQKPLAALGFLTLGRRFINSVPDIIDDRIDVTMRGFQGLTVGCARCHDHKFDPIPTQDYYSLYAVFNSSEEMAIPISGKTITEPWQRHNQRVTSAESSLRELILAQVKRLRSVPDLLPDVKQVLQAIGDSQIPDGNQLPKLLPTFERTAQEQITTQQKELDQLRKLAPQTPEFAMAMRDRQNCSDGVVFRRGNPGNPGDPAPRRFLLALSKVGEERPHWTNGSGRLELAQSITSKVNPLTARVFVNRVWQDHFGAGIVRTPSDYGRHGELPTDQALLDYLAWSFMESGWSVKGLQRLIVTSSTYLQSSTCSPTSFAVDPDNRLWSRMNRRRLDLEEMRDSLVKITGKLDIGDVGGRSVDLWTAPFTTRRALYGFIERQNLPGIFRTFDFASPDSHSARRFLTTVPQQALFFMNSSFSINQAKLVSEHSDIKGSVSDAQCVRRLYLTLFQRLPDADELTAGLAYLKPDRNSLVSTPLSMWQYGFGGFDVQHQRVQFFTALNYYSDMGYRVGKEFPDPVLGYLTLTHYGGHPGHDGNHAATRRWVAPSDVTVRISGILSHRQKEGDGVRGRIVSSRTGLVAEWNVHNSEIHADVGAVSLKKGDTLDFAVDPLSGDAYDSFQWAPVIRSTDGKRVWDSATNFGPPSEPPLTRLALYAQALMMTNEFMFVD